MISHADALRHFLSRPRQSQADSLTFFVHKTIGEENYQEHYVECALEFLHAEVHTSLDAAGTWRDACYIACYGYVRFIKWLVERNGGTCLSCRRNHFPSLKRTVAYQDVRLSPEFFDFMLPSSSPPLEP